MPGRLRLPFAPAQPIALSDACCGRPTDHDKIRSIKVASSSAAVTRAYVVARDSEVKRRFVANAAMSACGFVRNSTSRRTIGPQPRCLNRVQGDLTTIKETVRPASIEDRSGSLLTDPTDFVGQFMSASLRRRPECCAVAKNAKGHQTQT